MGADSRRHRRGGVDINGVFVLLNYLLLFWTALFYANRPLPRLVDPTTIALFGLLVLQVRWMLFYEHRHRNPLILVLAFILTLFHFPRITTLTWVDFHHRSEVLNRMHPASVDDINHALLFVFIANFAIVAGIVAGQRWIRRTTPPLPTSPRRGQATRLVLFLIAVLLYGVYTALIVPIGIGVEMRALRFLGLLLNPVFFLALSIVYLFLRARERGPGRPGVLRRSTLEMGVIAVCASLIVLAQAAFGSRAALLGLVQMGFFVVLALDLRRIPKKLIVAAALVLGLSVPLFVVSTYARAVRIEEGANVGLRVKGRWLEEALRSALQQTEVVDLLSDVFDRTAFLDFSVDLIKNRLEYAEVINLPFYVKSTVDNITPGFDVFDVPKASNALREIYSGERGLTRQSRAYQSDQFNVYGEYYVLFGPYGALPLLALGAFAFQAVLARIKARTSLETVMWRYFVIGLFFSWLISFGLDWLFIQAGRDAFLYLIVLPLVTRRLVWGMPERGAMKEAAAR